MITRPELAFLGFESTPHEAGERKAALVLSSAPRGCNCLGGYKIVANLGRLIQLEQKSINFMTMHL